MDSGMLAWRKSSHSSNGACVEVASTGTKVFVRDSKRRTGPVLTFTAQEWTAFLGGVRDGEFDLPQAPTKG